MLTQLRPAKINFYLRYMAGRGFSGARVLAGSGVSARELADRHALIEVSRYIRIVSNIHRLCGSPALAFDLGEALTLGDLGLLGYAVMSCQGTEEATRLWHRYNPVFFGNLVEMDFQRSGERWLLSYVPHPDIREDLLQFLIEEKIACDLALQRLIGLPEFPMERLSLAYPEPAHVARYRERIRCPIRFRALRNALLLRDNALDLPLQGGDPETHEHCLGMLNEVYHRVSARSTLSGKLRALLHADLQRAPRLEDLAATMHCTSRTLNRRLAKEGVNFSALLVATRLEAIKNLLATTRLENKLIAERVGFADVRSLRRFFGAQTGSTLQGFRAEVLHGSSGRSRARA